MSTVKPPLATLPTGKFDAAASSNSTEQTFTFTTAGCMVSAVAACASAVPSLCLSSSQDLRTTYERWRASFATCSSRSPLCVHIMVTGWSSPSIFSKCFVHFKCFCRRLTRIPLISGMHDLNSDLQNWLMYPWIVAVTSSTSNSCCFRMLIMT